MKNNFSFQICLLFHNLVFQNKIYEYHIINKITRYYLKKILAFKYFLGQEGWCLDENGVDQNDGAISLGYGWNESKCLEMCKDRKKFENVSACEYHKDSKGCGYHTNPVSKGSGHQDMAYTCWIFQSVGKQYA